MNGNLKNTNELFYESNKLDKEFSAHPHLKVDSNFSFSDENYPKKKAKELLKKAQKETDDNIKLNYLEECLLYNNTDEEVILELLNTKKDENEKKLILKKFGYYLTESNFKTYFNKPKKGVIELFKELFDLLENFRTQNLPNINKIFFFVEEFSLTKPQNIFLNELDVKEELSLYFITLSKMIAKLISSIKLRLNDNSMSFDDKLKKYFSTQEQKTINKLIELSKTKEGIEKHNFEDIKKILMFVNCQLFTQIFPSISNLIKSLKDEIKYCLDNLDNSNLYIFICIKELILNLLKGYNNLKNKEFISKIKNHFNFRNNDYYNNIYNYIKQYNSKSDLIKIEVDKENKNNLIFKKKIKVEFIPSLEETIILDNGYIYDWEKIINDDFILSLNFKSPLKYQLLNYIKIEYINEFNFIKYTYGFIEEFLLKISKSNTIISLLKEIYPGCEEIFNEKSSFISNLIKKVLSRCFYFCINSYRVGCTETQIKRIYFYLTYTINNDLDPVYDLKKFLIVNLGLFIYIFHHEFFGHYLLHYLKILTTNKYNSPFSKIENKEESGRFIEIKLFGKRMNTLNLFQILYILDIDNYKKNYKEFSLDFQKIDKFNISENFFNMFKKHFEIELILDKYEKIESYTVTDYNIGNNNNLLIITPTFNDCLPFDEDELLYNLLY